MVSGWFPTSACAPVLPTTHVTHGFSVHRDSQTLQVRKRWHRRVLDGLNKLTPQELLALVVALAFSGGLLSCFWWWSCAPGSVYLFTHCAQNSAATELLDEHVAQRMAAQRNTPGSPHKAHPELVSAGNRTGPVSELLLTSLHVTEGKTIHKGQNFVFGQHRYTVSGVVFEKGVRGGAEVKLTPDSVKNAGEIVPVDESEPQEDILFGVGPGDRTKYQKIVETEEFKCMSTSKGGMVSLPIKYINDDYCDCSDGTDEPGTSACQVSSVLSRSN